MSFYLTQVLAAGSLASLFFSMQAIENVKHYEKAAENAAQISNTVKEQVWETRLTEAAGTVSSVVSLASALFVTYPSAWGHAGITVFVAMVLNATLLLLSSFRIAKFWEAKERIPGARRYNDAIYQTNTVKQLLWGLAVLWVITGGYYFLFENE